MKKGFTIFEFLMLVAVMGILVLLASSERRENLARSSQTAKVEHTLPGHGLLLSLVPGTADPAKWWSRESPGVATARQIDPDPNTNFAVQAGIWTIAVCSRKIPNDVTSFSVSFSLASGETDDNEEKVVVFHRSEIDGACWNSWTALDLRRVGGTIYGYDGGLHY